MQEERFQFRGSDKLKQQWIDACDRMRVPQNECFLALLEFFISQPELTREAMVRRGTTVKVTAGNRKPRRL